MGVMNEWQTYAQNQRQLGIRASLDLPPQTRTQAAERDDILNMGRFVDAMFNVVPRS
jgi:hypothetical protein